MQPPLGAFDALAARCVPVVVAELVVLDRGRVERDHARSSVEAHRASALPAPGCARTARPIGRRGKGAHGAPRAEPGAHRPVAVARNARPSLVEVEVDRRELGPNARVGGDEANQVVGVGDVPQRLLEHEPDAGQLDTGLQRLRVRSPCCRCGVEPGQELARVAELFGHTPVVLQVVERAQRDVGGALGPRSARRAGRHRRRATTALPTRGCRSETRVSVANQSRAGRGTRLRWRRGARPGLGRARR